MRIQSIFVLGKRWFDRVNGNTYNSVEIFVNGRKVAILPFGYGYGDYYEQRAEEWLIDHGFLEVERYPSGGHPPLWRVAKEQGFEYEREAIDVSRKRDLEQKGWVRD